MQRFFVCVEFVGDEVFGGLTAPGVDMLSLYDGRGMGESGKWRARGMVLIIINSCFALRMINLFKFVKIY